MDAAAGQRIREHRVMRRASHSRDAELVPLTTSFASTGSATGLAQNGSQTMTASTTQLLPRPVFAGPCADPSWNQDAAQTVFPRRRNSVSSTATRTGSPAGTSSDTASLAAARPSSSGSQRAREKKECARSWLQARDRPAPDSMPHTVRFPGWARNTGSLFAELSTDIQGGNTLQAYSDFNAYSLELLDHTMKPLLSPLLDETSKGVTTLSIPVELSEIQTNLLEAFGDYNELKGFAQTVLSPEISGMFALSSDIQNISTEFTAGDTSQGLSDLNNLSSDVIGALVNGYDAGTNPFNGAAELFPGLINTGSFLDELYTTWTEQFITALGSLGA